MNMIDLKVSVKAKFILSAYQSSCIAAARAVYDGGGPGQGGSSAQDIEIENSE